MTPSSQAKIEIAESTLNAVRQRAAPALLAWLGQLGLPAAQAQQIASGLVADQLDMRVVGAQLLATWLAQQNGDLVSAAAIWKGLIELRLGSPPDSPPRAEMLFTSIMNFGAIAFNAGDGDSLIERASAWSELLQGHGRNEAASNLRVNAAEALLSQGQYERARDLLAAERKSGIPAVAAPVVARLDQKLDQILRRPDETVGTFDPERVLALTREWLKAEPWAARALVETGLRVDTTIEQAMENVDLPAFPQPPRDHEGLAREAARLKTSRTPIHHLLAICDSCINEFVAAGNDQARLGALIGILPGVIRAADQLKMWEDATTARWIEALTLKRLGRKADALTRLLEIAARIDERRLQIGDPRLRAGVAVYLKHLAWVTAEIAFDLRNETAALHAIETGKARILAELRTAASSRERMAPAAFLEATRGLLADPKAAGRRHLVSFLSDTTAPTDAPPGEVGTLALLVPCEGPCRFARIKLSFVQIVAAVRQLQQLVEGDGSPRRAAKIDPAHPEQRSFDRTIEVLSPLTSWLEPLFDDGTIAAGDTIIVSADGPIHNVPLAMLPVGAEPLLARVAVVNTPTAALLVGRAPAAVPDRAICYAAPAPGERERMGGAEQEGMGTVGARMRTRMLDGAELGRDGLLKAVGEAARANETLLLHFATHGSVQVDRPLRERGLALRGTDDDWLTAEQVAELRLSGAHVSLRACVSGVVREITSREALGLVWAFFGAGTSSLVATAWNVDIPSAGRFFTRFYDAWLKGGMTRAAAHRHAACALRNEGGALAHPYHWAPFVLSFATLEGDVA
jgi:CHAT domain-containing protein